MDKRFTVRLSDAQRRQLKTVVERADAPSFCARQALILLGVDANGARWTDAQAAAAHGCHRNTVRNLRRRFVQHGLEAALARKKQHRASRPPICDAKAAAQLYALSATRPPDGSARWTLRTLASRSVELGIVPSISHETIRQLLKKRSRYTA